MSDLLEVRVIAAPPTATQAVTRLAELVALDRQTGPYPSRKTPGLVLYYLTGRLRPGTAAAGCASSIPATKRTAAQGPPAAMTVLEDRLTEGYVRVLDVMSGCAQAVDQGHWHDLHDKATELESATAWLAEIASDATSQRAQHAQPPRATVVHAAVASLARHYRAGRLLHPAVPHREGGADR